MSELIDRIVDVTTISKEISDTIANLNLLNASIEAVKLNVTSLADATRKAKVGEDLIKNSKSLNDEFTKGGQVMKAWEIEVQKLNEKTEKLTTSEKAASIEIAKARLELAAATKATKEAAIADIEKTANNGKLSDSYNGLQRQLKNSIAEYKNLSQAELAAGKGKELLSKINETQASLKKTDASMGNYQRNVGNYASALEGLTPKLGGLAGTLLNIAQSAKKSQDELNEMGGDNGLGIMSNPRIPAGLAKIMTGIKGIGQSAIAMGKAFFANPIIAVAGSLVFIFTQVKKAFEESEERSNKLNEAMARLAPIGRTIGDVFEVIADGFIKFVEVSGKAIAAVTEFLGINPKGSADQFAKAEKMKQDAIINTRKAAERASKLEADLENQRAIIADKESYSFEQRMQALKKAEQLEKQLAATKTEIARQNLKAVLAENALDDNNAEANQRKTDAVVAFNKVKQEQATLSRKLSKDEQKLIKENEADLKEQAATAKATADKIIAARRRLVDSQFAIQEESEQKSIDMSNEAFNRQIEDLKNNGELTKSLKSNLEKAQDAEILKIKNEWKVKQLNDDIKLDELIISQMQKNGQDTLKEQKALLKKQMDAEILAGGDLATIQLKYQYLSLNLEEENSAKKIALFEKTIAKQAELLSQDYAKKELQLKKDFSLTKQTAKDKLEYEEKLRKLQLDALLDVNNKQIEALQQLLTDSKLTDDKRAELSKKLADLKIANEEAVTDAIIAENEKQVAADDDGRKKREAIVVALANATKEIFSEIANFATQQSEQRIAELEKEQEASDASFETSQTNLDNALMSDENRIAKQLELDNKKAAADKAIADKIQAEKIKQAKWEKANAIIQAVISTGLAILEGSKQPIPLNFIAIGLAASVGAIQLATIASQSIPAYEKGTESHPGGLSLWGEKRAEVAVLPSGDTFLATKPTVTNFDAGTKIYDSVQAYENAMGKQALQEVTFDYDKFGEMMPRLDVKFDANGLLIMRDKAGNRRALLNRRYKR